MERRSKKPQKVAKSNVLRIRLVEKDRSLLDEAARSKSLDTSTWARSELVALAKNLLGRK